MPARGAANYDTLTLGLPTGWTATGAVSLGGTPLSCSGGCTGNRPVYSIGVSLGSGESRPLALAVSVPGGAAGGLYDVDLQIWASQSMFGGSFETYFPRAATAAVGASVRRQGQ